MGLTSHDSAVLAALFDAEGVVSSPSGHQDQPTTTYPALSSNSLPEQPLEPSSRQEQDQDNLVVARERAILLPLNVEQPDPAAVTTALADLTNLITTDPHRPSLYTNRAQTVRLLYDVDTLLTATATAPAKGDSAPIYSAAFILSDLSSAIALARQSPTPPQTQPTLAAAHTHAGFLLLRGAALARKGVRPTGLGDALADAGAEALEERAGREFATGAKAGGQVARAAAVATNPYARLCGAIVQEAMGRERAEWAAAHDLGVA